MILKIFTREENSETEEALNFGKELEEDFSVEYYDLDSSEAHQQAEIYEIFIAPSFVAAQDDGREVSAWRGTTPTANEVRNFLSQ